MKKVLSLILTVCLLMSLLPMNVFASTASDNENECIHDWSNGDGLCVNCGWECPHTEYVDDGDPVDLGWSDESSCKKVAQKCELCGVAGEDRIIGHTAASEWQRIPHLSDGNFISACVSDGQHTEVLLCPDCFFTLDTRIVTDAKTGHDYIEYEATESTCTISGTIAHKYCVACYNYFAVDATYDEPYENAEYDIFLDVNPENHTWVEYKAKDADCENVGYTEDHKYCAGCYLFVIGEETTDVVIDWDLFYYYDDVTGEPIGEGAKLQAQLGTLERDAFVAYIAENYPELDLEVAEYPEDTTDYDAMDAYYASYYGAQIAIAEVDEDWYDAWYEYWVEIIEETETEACHEALLLAAETAGYDLVIPALGDAATDENFKFAGANLTLTDDISVNYNVEKTNVTDYTDLYVKFQFGGKEYTVKNYTVSGDYYVFKFDNISPNKMNDIIYATLYGTKDGVEYASEQSDYSVSQYCYNMLDKCADNKYAEFRTLLVDLLNYGAQSQIYTSYNTDNLANAALTDTQKAWGTQGTPTLSTVQKLDYETVENPTVKWCGGGLTLEDSVTMRFTIETESIENLVVKVVTADKTYTIKASAFKSIGNNRYYVYFSGLNAAQMSEEVYLTVYNGEEAVSNTLRYSIESYAYAKAGDSDTKLSELVIAMMKYGNAAYNYVN